LHQSTQSIIASRYDLSSGHFLAKQKVSDYKMQSLSTKHPIDLQRVKPTVK